MILLTVVIGFLILFLIYVWMKSKYLSIGNKLVGIANHGIKKIQIEKKEYPKLNFIEKKLPRDEKDSSFIKSFFLDQEKEWMEFFDEYGFVVIRDVLSKEEVDATVNEIWNIIEFKDGKRAKELEMIKKVCNLEDKPVILPDKNDPRTWTIKDNGWPVMANVGLLGADTSFDKQALLNRFNPNIYKVFSKIYKTDKLWCSFDRYGFIRPTKNIDMGGKKIDKLEWKTTEKWLHLDMNPYKVGSNECNFDPKRLNFISENNDNYTDSIKLQGILSLVDAKEETGGFLCIPGFHKYLLKWADDRKNELSRVPDFFNIPKDDEIQNYTQKIPVRAGSLIIWNSMLPHCNFPNDSDQPRICQYLKHFPARTNAPKEFLEHRKKIILDHLPKDIELNDFRKSLLGLDL